MSETVLRWLHITDLHLGKGNESQITAIRSLLDSAVKHAQGRPFDAVLITGDLAHSGIAEQYASLRELIVAPLRSHALWRNAELIATPGNHDLDCEIEIPPSWKDLGRQRQEKFFHAGPDGIKTRASRPKAFAEYSQFTKSSGIKSVDPLLEPAALFRLEHGSIPITFISVVTAFFSDKEVSDRHRAPAPVHAVRTALQKVVPGDVVVVLGHHPVDWFTPESEAQFHSLLVENNLIYLHGHEHKTRTRFGQRGLISLGFGAAYQATQDNLAPSSYRNSYAICELSDVLHVAVVSWDGEHGLWRPDKNLPGDFVDRSEHLEDGYRLNLPTTRVIDHPRPYASLASAIKTQLSVDECLWLSGDHSRRWTSLLSDIGVFRGPTETYSLPTQTLPAGHAHFRVRDSVGLHLVRAVSGHGVILPFLTEARSGG
jgi:predicted MPP superfamily phosphohydrolase